MSSLATDAGPEHGCPLAARRPPTGGRDRRRLLARVGLSSAVSTSRYRWSMGAHGRSRSDRGRPYGCDAFRPRALRPSDPVAVLAAAHLEAHHTMNWTGKSGPLLRIKPSFTSGPLPAEGRIQRAARDVGARGPGHGRGQIPCPGAAPGAGQSHAACQRCRTQRGRSRCAQ